ncbi:MAG: mechanosensitive ion channel family protein [Leptolyngbya sp. SIO1D8]|nr:mechanosensitive ion channel family protein [Leptolyngbya sp. SIO1D8]
MGRHSRRGLLKAGFISFWVVLWISMSGPSAFAQLGSSILDLSAPDSTQVADEGEEAVMARCVRLDGHCAFRVAAPSSDLNGRVKTIEKVLAGVSKSYVTTIDPVLEVELLQEDVDVPRSSFSATETPEGSEPPVDTAPKSPSIYLSVNRQKPVKLMNLTRFDANLKGVDVETAAEEYGEQVRGSLELAREERQSRYLLTQVGICFAVIVLLLGISWAMMYRERQLRNVRSRLKDSLRVRSQSLQSVLDERQQWNVTEVQLRFVQLVRAGLWIGGVLLILSRFPYTRIIKVRVIDSLYIPFRLLLIALTIYLAIRLSFALINRLTAILASSYEITPELNRRMQLRVNTISRVSRGIVILAWLGVGGLLSLTAVGLNIGPLLAGAGIIGLALSLPAQSLIKDAINGFFIILEDQYAVGDVITVHGIRGLVENINLRITQLRDEEGRLVTIPNSEIGLIANHSSNWSQADVYIPISYHTDVDVVLDLIQKIGIDMKASDRWQDAMLVEPEVLGVEDFGERGLTIRVWIKTQPLKQWDVAREYRRRLKVALDAEGIVIPAHIDFKAPTP